MMRSELEVLGLETPDFWVEEKDPDSIRMGRGR